MAGAKSTTTTAPQFKLKQEDVTGNNGGGGESSFRVLYYGNASAGSVPFMWESQPGTPKHQTTQSDLPPLTPPPALQYNATSLRTLFLASSSRKTHVPLATPSDSSISDDNFRKQSTSLRRLFLASSSRKANRAATPSMYSSLPHSLPSTPMSKGGGKTGFWQRGAMEEDGGEKHVGGDGSPTSTLCFGGGLMKVYRMKKAKGKTKKIN